jgi:gamma-glutamylputrescine oxidase
MRLVNQNWWFTTLLVNQHKYCPSADARHQVRRGDRRRRVRRRVRRGPVPAQGFKVVLIDKNIVGGSSSGRSAGFLTPDSELELHQLCRRYGNQAAREIWDAPCSAIDGLVRNIEKYDIACGLLKQDSLFLGLGKHGHEAAKAELECRQDVGFTDQKLYDEQQLKGILGAVDYTAGIRYGGTYGINPLQCLQGFKDLLVDDGMQVFEATEMERLEGHTVYTHAGSITADQIIIAVDKLEPHISELSAECFHAQTFLSVTEPLTDQELKVLFPSGEQLQCWDSKLVYTYFRLTKDNRLLLGGGLGAHHLPQRRVQQSGNHQARDPRLLQPLSRAQERVVHAVLAGQIDTTRDLLPTIVRPKDQPHMRFIFGCVGIPWAAFTGTFAARNILGEADAEYDKYFNYFSNERNFWLPSSLGKVIGKPLLFSLSNSWAKFRQVDQLRARACRRNSELAGLLRRLEARRDLRPLLLVGAGDHGIQPCRDRRQPGARGQERLEGVLGLQCFDRGESFESAASRFAPPSSSALIASAEYW